MLKNTLCRLLLNFSLLLRLYMYCSGPKVLESKPTVPLQLAIVIVLSVYMYVAG